MQNQRTFCADSPIFWDISSRIWQRIYANRTNRISPVRTDFPNLVLRDITQFQRKAPSFLPPKKNKQNGKALGPLKHLDPRQGATPKDVDGTSEVQQCIDIPWKETNEEGTQIQPLFPSEHKGPLMFLREFLFRKKSPKICFLLGGAGVWKVLRSGCVR